MANAGGEWTLRIRSNTRKDASGMQRRTLSCLISLASFSLLLALLSSADASVTTFGTGSNQFDMTFVEIGNPGNVDDTTGPPKPGRFGGVRVPAGEVRTQPGHDHEVQRELRDR